MRIEDQTARGDFGNLRAGHEIGNRRPRELAVGRSGESAALPEIVTLAHSLPGTPDIASAPRRVSARQVPWWVTRSEPDFALHPPAGDACPQLKGKSTKVIGFALFGLAPDAVATEVDRVERLQRKQNDFVPVFLTDCADHEPFRRRHFAFEYFPAHGGGLDLAALQPRIEFIENKWGVDLLINLGMPRGEPVRRETRPLAARYQLAKQHLAHGRIGHARRLLAGFTDALNAAATHRVYGQLPAAPSASLVVVSHRDHPGVAKGLKSIAGQIGKDIEVILVDNGNGRLLRHGRSLFASFRLVRTGFNAGCSAARNAGAHHAQAPYLIFLDDDGIAAEGCIAALLNAITRTGAVAVRGRVRAATPYGSEGTHYDLGAERSPAFVTTEGVSIWARQPFRAAGGFDPLLAGHEGLELCTRLWRLHGPAGFRYEPEAVLLHDYARSDAASAEKSRKYESNLAYLDTYAKAWRDISTIQQRYAQDPLAVDLPTPAAPSKSRARRASVSILTTAKDGLPFLAEYSRSIRSQTEEDFEVSFVDDHSRDGTLEAIRAMWSGDSRLKACTNAGRGRAAALNAALNEATGDICLIADVDDLSVPQRIAATRSYFAANRASDCMSFCAFNEWSALRVGSPRSPFVDDVAVRLLFGTPVSFPAFAFRRQALKLPFDESLRAGVDCDWLYRNCQRQKLQGKVIYWPAVYYREHEGQITAKRRDTQMTVRRAAIRGAFGWIIGPLNDNDCNCIAILTETRQATAAMQKHLARWVLALLEVNRQKRVFDPHLLDLAMCEALRGVELLP